MKLREKLGDEPLSRFIPYVQMYEFEGLLFSDPEKMAQGIGQISLSGSLMKIRNQFNSPEEINDSVTTAPSKRIEKLFTAYEKPLHGSLAAKEIGLDVIRRECKRFDEWLKKLAALRSLESA